MNIEKQFLQKAIKDRNYISFTYQKKPYKNIAPLNLLEQEALFYLHTKNQSFNLKEIKKLTIHKEKF